MTRSLSTTLELAVRSAQVSVTSVQPQFKNVKCIHGISCENLPAQGEYKIEYDCDLFGSIVENVAKSLATPEMKG